MSPVWCHPAPSMVSGAWAPGATVALIPRCHGSRAALCPSPGQGSLLADAGLLLPQEFERLAAGVLWQRCVCEGGEVALKDAWAAASWPG